MDRAERLSAVHEVTKSREDKTAFYDSYSGQYEELAEKGFTKLDALDPSQGMLEVAKAKGIYQNFICEYIDERELDIKADSYDVVTISGGCSNNHLPCSCLKEIIRLVKPGGYFVMVTLLSHFDNIEEYKGRFEPLVDSFEREKKWEKVRKDIVPRYNGDKDGVVFVYQIL